MPYKTIENRRKNACRWYHRHKELVAERRLLRIAAQSNETQEEARRKIREYQRTDKQKANRARYVRKHPEQVRETQRKSRLKRIDKARDARMRKVYGVTLLDFKTRLMLQSNACDICKTAFVKESNAFIDHCHSTGRVRGLLCVRCNVGLGSFKDRPDLLIAAATYLGKNV